MLTFSYAEGEIMSGLTFGVKASQQLAPLADQRAVWRAAEDGGFDSVWLFDHFLPMSRTARTGDILEAWTLLAALAATTSRIRIGTLVTGNHYRHPGVLAKMAVTVDHVSGGRLEMGLGAGGDPEADGMLGIPAEPARVRIERLAEACRVLDLLWTQPVSSFDGEHYRLVEALADPKPLQRPRPPIWIGSSGARYGLRVVAEHADVWLNASRNAADPDELARLAQLSAALERHCADVGRDPATIRHAVQVVLPAADDELLRSVERLVGAGFTDIVLMPAAGGLRQVEQAAGLLPELRGLG
jgi:alkanesulfonate monooxygenase SsuD/methylene tetrahydromethanopterin reductase-like flavin-dependent oxidoreductase (luciferase family)